MDPFRRASSPAEFRRHIAEAGRERQPCMLCGAQVAPHARDLTLIREDGAQMVIVARFCTRCHNRPDRATRTQAALQRLCGDVPLVFTQRPPTRRRN
jgi:hypothetical protein